MDGGGWRWVEVGGRWVGADGRVCESVNVWVDVWASVCVREKVVV